jgi:hypothetical protein
MLVLDEEQEEVVLRVPRCCPQKLPWTFYILLTVHLDAILDNDQLDALFLNVFIYASTCFEQQVLIIRRAKLY